MRPTCNPLALALMLIVTGSLSAQSWVAGPSFTTVGGRQYAAGVTAAGVVYALGGTPFTGVNDAAAHMISATGSAWTVAPATEGHFTSIAAEVDALGRIIVFGGAFPAGDPGEAYVWDAVNGNNGGINNRSNSCPGTNFAHCSDAQGRIWSIGGGPGANPTLAAPNSHWVERYDASTDLWTAMPAMPSQVADATAVYDGMGRILVFGGFNAAGVRTANVACFDTNISQWSDTTIPDMPAPRSGARAVRGLDGLIRVIGGSDGVIRNTVFVFNPISGAWNLGPNMTTARQHFGCTMDAQGWVWAMGGTTPTGATNSVEKLFTPTCPTVTVQPVSATVYSGSGAGFSITIGGSAPFTYQWRRNGVPLVNGATGSGSTIVGATSAGLGIQGVVAADIASYDCVVNNLCGSVTSAAATITLLPAPVLPQSFQLSLLHPAGAQHSRASGIAGNKIAGSAKFTSPPYAYLDHPITWSLSGSSMTDHTPANSVGGEIAAIRGDLAVGWYWAPYTVPGVGTGYHANSAAWSIATGQFWALNYGGNEIHYATCTDGTRIAGWGKFDETSLYSRAMRWPTVTSFAYTTPPTGTTSSSFAAVEGNDWYGAITQGATHAVRLNGNVWTDMHPAGATGGSYINDAASGQIVGYVGSHAALWSGSVNGWMSLAPAGAVGSSASACLNGYQVGDKSLANGGFHAMLWSGNSAAPVDLHTFLPAIYGSSSATDLMIHADGSLTICGMATNTSVSPARQEAVAWHSGDVLQQNASTLSFAAGGTVQWQLHGGTARAGHNYLLLGSLSGTTPGYALPGGGTLGLLPDAYFFFLASNPNTLITSSMGVLNASGNAAASVTIPAGAALPMAIPVWHAFVSFPGTTPQFSVSNSTQLWLF